MKNLKYIFDIGSSKISLLACCVNGGETLIVSSIDKQYDGFMDGEFFSPEGLADTFSSLLQDMALRVGKPIDNVFVGVPGEFSACVCKRVTRSFIPGKKLTEHDIATLFDGVADFASADDYTMISYSPMQFELDGYATLQAVNRKVNDLVMECSYILVKNTFLKLIDDSLNKCGVKNIEYISSVLAQGLFAVQRFGSSLQPMVIVDVGHITTTLAVVKGEGLMMLSSFSLGGGHITADLMQVGRLSYADAELIKRKVSLTIQAKRDERYILYNDGREVNSLISITNDVVNSRLESIANVLKRLLDKPQFEGLPIYLTGDGVCNFRGVDNLFEAIMERETYLLKAPLDNGKDKYQTSKIGLAELIGKIV